MIHQLFYEGKLFGPVINPVNSASHAWLCQQCGRIFAVRISPFRSPDLDRFCAWTFWESYCARCASKWEDLTKQYFDGCQSMADFRRGGDASDQLATLRVQFLYESEIFYDRT